LYTRDAGCGKVFVVLFLHLGANVCPRENRFPAGLCVSEHADLVVGE
jgi:hypothetical protein